MNFFVITLARIFAIFHRYHVRKPLASHNSILLYDQPAYMLRKPITKLISAVKSARALQGSKWHMQRPASLAR
jgi:hypothetical protein